LGERRELAVSPTASERDRDREHAGPVARRHAIEVADQFPEEIVGIQFLDNRLQEWARPSEPRRACREQPHRTRTKLRPPPLDIEPVLGPVGLFEVLVNVGDGVLDDTHDDSSPHHGAYDERARPDRRRTWVVRDEV
jgi:hypothetical protein